MILVCSGLALDRFTHDSSLFRFGIRQGFFVQVFRQVYT